MNATFKRCAPAVAAISAMVTIAAASQQGSPHGGVATRASRAHTSGGPQVPGGGGIGIDANVYIDDQGHRFTGPPVDTGKPSAFVAGAQTPGGSIAASTTTGGYRRVFSHPGYNRLSATITLPCRSAHLIGDEDNYDIETGFVYTGGWGAGVNGAAIDAGFQKSSWQDGSPNDAYALFILYKGRMTTKQRPSDADLIRFACGKPVQLAFGPDSDGTIAVSADGIGTNRKTVHERLTVPSAPSDGWGFYGGTPSTGAIVKRMTTIGQPDQPRNGASSASSSAFQARLRSLGTTWDTDGSYFGVDPVTHAATVRWSNVRIGRYLGSVPQDRPWQSNDTYGCHNVPSRDKVAVHYVDPATEEDGVLFTGSPSGRRSIMSCH